MVNCFSIYWSTRKIPEDFTSISKATGNEQCGFTRNDVMGGGLMNLLCLIHWMFYSPAWVRQHIGYGILSEDLCSGGSTKWWIYAKECLWWWLGCWRDLFCLCANSLGDKEKTLEMQMEGRVCFFKTGEQLEEIAWSLFHFSSSKKSEYSAMKKRKIVWDFGPEIEAVLSVKNSPNL